MEILNYEEDYFERLFSFWKKLAQNIPYFFSVSAERWHECLLEDKLGNEKLFHSQETFIAKEKDQIVGFSQYGQPAFGWNQDGEKYNNPSLGVIRHFYFDEGRFDVAELLFAESESYVKQFPYQHAFYHIYGMSCNAHHGKLHQSLAHVGWFLCGKGYQVEHENVYYSLELNGCEPSPQDELQLVSKPILEPNTQDYKICLENHPIGTIQIRYLGELTGGFTTDIAYMTWIEIRSEFHRQGWGTKALQLLAADLKSKEYRQLHLDTASTNQAVGRFYEHFGFQNRGKTRSYLKTTSQ